MIVKRRVVFGVFLAAVGVTTFGWFKFVAQPKPVACAYCNRPLYPNLSVTSEIAGKKAQACCSRCAISEANQQHKRLNLIAVHDYLTSKEINGSNAWFVVGSRALSCERGPMPMNEMKHSESMAFDRCTPGTLAFASKPDADTFVTQNGGSIFSYEQLMKEARFQ